MGQTPVTVIGGYLGAGKTTLVNHLLRHAKGLRLAVLVNDFGDIAIDADLIESRDNNVISIAGGCICCSFGSDLMAALMALAARTPGPQQVLIETSGVALPGIVARSVKLLTGYALEGIVVLADAETVRSSAADHYMGDTIERQLSDSDLIVLNKTDLVEPAALQDISTWLGATAPRARILTAVRGILPAEVLLGALLQDSLHDKASALQGKMRSHAAFSANMLFESASFIPAVALDVVRLAQLLAQPALGVIRAKGLLLDRDDSMKTLQVVGARWEVGAHVGGTAQAGRLVCIGLKRNIDRFAIEQAIAGATAR